MLARSTQGPSTNIYQEKMGVECKLPAILPYPCYARLRPVQIYRCPTGLPSHERTQNFSLSGRKEVEGPKQKSNGENQTVPESGGAGALRPAVREENEKEERKRSRQSLLPRVQTRPTTPRVQVFLQLGRKMDSHRPTTALPPL